ERHTGCLAARDVHPRHRRVDAYFHTTRSGFLRHGLGDRSHAAYSMPPDAFFAVHFAKHVVQQHVGGARRVWAGEVADDGIEPERGLDRIGLEPRVKHVTGALPEQVEQVTARHHTQPEQTSAEFERVDQVRQAATDV